MMTLGLPTMNRRTTLLCWMLSLTLLIASTAHAQLTRTDKTKKTTTSSKPKEPKRSGPINNWFQDMTARYNRYYNADLKYDESEKALTDRTKENYTELLPVFPYKSGDGRAMSTNLDEVVKKTSINIQKKPNSKWVDDSYLLLGQSYYLLGDNDAATKSFQYIVSRYGNSIRRTYDRVSKERQQKLREKEREEQKENRQYEQKLREKQREEDIEKEQKKREEAKKETEKEREKLQKEREKTQKERAKEREKEIKEREKEQKERIREREKAQKQRERDRKNGIRTPPRTREQFVADSTAAADKRAEEAAAKAAEKETELSKKEAAAQKKKEETEALRKQAEEEEAARMAEEAADSADAAKGLIDENEGQEKTYRGGGFLRHKPAKHDAMLWLARTHIEADKMGDANSLIQRMNADNTFPRRKVGELRSLEAAYYLKNEQYEAAKTALEEAVKKVRPRSERARLYYILGQLQQRGESHKEAIASYEKVTRSKPLYEMELNARLNIAKLKVKSGAWTSESAIARLEKMSKEDKNIDFADQIYFAMAEIAGENGDMEQAADLLAKSAGKSTVNKEQKAASFLKLADMNYEAERYLKASSYYDLTFTLLTKTSERYTYVSERKVLFDRLGSPPSHGRIARQLAAHRRYVHRCPPCLFARFGRPDESRSRQTTSCFCHCHHRSNQCDRTGHDLVFLQRIGKAVGLSNLCYSLGRPPIGRQLAIALQIGRLRNQPDCPSR